MTPLLLSWAELAALGVATLLVGALGFVGTVLAAVLVAWTIDAAQRAWRAGRR